MLQSFVRATPFFEQASNMRSLSSLVAAASVFVASVSALGSSCSAPLSPSAAASDPFWLQSIAHLGTSPYNSNSAYKVFRNVKDYGAKGDGASLLSFFSSGSRSNVR